MKERDLAQYTVPSQSHADTRYTIIILDGDAHCNCAWGQRSGDTPIQCWHVRLARCIHYAPDFVDPLSDQAHQDARHGRLSQQVYIIRCCLDDALSQERYDLASRIAEMLGKYMHSLSFSGALPLELETKEEETAQAVSLVDMYRVN